MAQENIITSLQITMVTRIFDLYNDLFFQIAYTIMWSIAHSKDISFPGGC